MRRVHELLQLQVECGHRSETYPSRSFVLFSSRAFSRSRISCSVLPKTPSPAPLQLFKATCLSRSVPDTPVMKDQQATADSRSSFGNQRDAWNSGSRLAGPHAGSECIHRLEGRPYTEPALLGAASQAIRLVAQRRFDAMRGTLTFTVRDISRVGMTATAAPYRSSAEHAKPERVPSQTSRVL